MSSHDCSFLFKALDALSGSTSDMLRYIQVACSDVYKWHAQIYTSEMVRRHK